MSSIFFLKRMVRILLLFFRLIIMMLDLKQKFFSKLCIFTIILHAMIEIRFHISCLCSSCCVVVIEFALHMRISVKNFRRDKFSDSTIFRKNKVSDNSLSESLSRRKFLHLMYFPHWLRSPFLNKWKYLRRSCQVVYSP